MNVSTWASTMKAHAYESSCINVDEERQKQEDFLGPGTPPVYRDSTGVSSTGFEATAAALAGGVISIPTEGAVSTGGAGATAFDFGYDCSPGRDLMR